MSDYHGPERRKIELSDDDIERIAKRAGEIAKDLALRDIYVAVGKSVVSKILWVLGTAGLAIAAWLHLKPTP